jgi:hypothetical protein
LVFQAIYLIDYCPTKTDNYGIFSAPPGKPPCAGFVVSVLLETHRKIDLRIFPARHRALGELVLINRHD